MSDVSKLEGVVSAQGFFSDLSRILPDCPPIVAQQELTHYMRAYRLYNSVFKMTGATDREKQLITRALCFAGACAIDKSGVIYYANKITDKAEMYVINEVGGGKSANITPDDANFALFFDDETGIAPAYEIATAVAKIREVETTDYLRLVEHGFERFVVADASTVASIVAARQNARAGRYTAVSETIVQAQQNFTKMIGDRPLDYLGDKLDEKIDRIFAKLAESFGIDTLTGAEKRERMIADEVESVGSIARNYLDAKIQARDAATREIKAKLGRVITWTAAQTMITKTNGEQAEEGNE
jgi:hypothetical protein